MTIDNNGILRDYTQNDINHCCSQNFSVVPVGHEDRHASRPRLGLVGARTLVRRLWEQDRIECVIMLNDLDENVWTWDNRAQAERIYWHGDERRAGFDEI